MGLHGIDFWKLKTFCRQCEMEDAIRFMYEYTRLMPPSVIIHWRVESQFWNKPVQQAILKVRKEYGNPLNLVVAERSRQKKYDRLITMHPYYQGRRVFHNIAEEANNDMQEGLKQLYGIEPGYTTHDDSPDADQQVMEYLSQFVVFQLDENDGGTEIVETGTPRRNNRM